MFPFILPYGRGQNAYRRESSSRAIIYTFGLFVHGQYELQRRNLYCKERRDRSKIVIVQERTFYIDSHSAELANSFSPHKPRTL